MTLLRGGGGHHLEEHQGHAQVPGPLTEPAALHYEQTVRDREGGAEGRGAGALHRGDGGGAATGGGAQVEVH